MISKHDVVGGGKFSKWQLDLKGKVRGRSQHVTFVQQE
jgi:hypothetical protein